jgi:hypothetical protein
MVASGIVAESATQGVYSVTAEYTPNPAYRQKASAAFISFPT